MTARKLPFARDKATSTYYDQRAAEYDEWYSGAAGSQAEIGPAGVKR